MSESIVQFETRQDNSNIPGVDDVDPTEVFAKKAQLLVVDVRRPEEFNGELGHIPGARSIVLDTLPARLDELPKDKTLVFVCLSGGRSGRAAAFAKEHGYTRIFNMRGGMQLWHELGLGIEEGSAT